MLNWQFRQPAFLKRLKSMLSVMKTLNNYLQCIVVFLNFFSRNYADGIGILQELLKGKIFKCNQLLQSELCMYDVFSSTLWNILQDFEAKKQLHLLKRRLLLDIISENRLIQKLKLMSCSKMCSRIIFFKLSNFWASWMVL